MKRRLTVGILVALFFTALFGLSGCGLLSQAGNADLTNAAGGENGPGSGNWKPQVPKTDRQARQLFAVLETLSKNGTEEADAYDELYVFCLNEKKELRAGRTAEECFPPLAESARIVTNIFVDFDSGSTVWDVWAEANGDDDDKPDPPNPPDPPKEDPPPKDDPEDTEPSWGCPPYCCLTCTQNLDVEYVFIPAPVEIEIPSS